MHEHAIATRWRCFVRGECDDHNLSGGAQRADSSRPLVRLQTFRRVRRPGYPDRPLRDRIARQRVGSEQLLQVDIKSGRRPRATEGRTDTVVTTAPGDRGAPRARVPALSLIRRKDRPVVITVPGELGQVETEVDARHTGSHAVRQLGERIKRPQHLRRGIRQRITRLGKVVFYDYDEIEYITDCNFRRIPPRDDQAEELGPGEVWFDVGAKDVFPETFGPFLLGNARVRQAFMKHHADLLDPGFWSDNKQRILAGEMPDIFPYDVQRRFGFLRRDSGWGTPTGIT